MNQSPPKIYGLIGYPVKHSLSPAMHNAAFKHLGINAEYRLFPIKPEELEAFLLKDIIVKDIDENVVRAKDILGFNITLPHKVKAKEILEREFPFDKNASLILEALHYVKISDAINTVRRTDDKLEYFNTDARGFLESLEKDLQFDTKNRNALVIGCGGAGRTIISVLSWKQHKINRIFINDISDEVMDSAKKHFSQFQYIGDKVEFISRKQIPEIIKQCQLLVNASPVGMKETDDSVIDKNLLHDGLSVYDVVYNRETQLIKDARSKDDRPVVGGLLMLLRQGIEAFEIWTGKTAPIEVMRQSLPFRDSC